MIQELHVPCEITQHVLILCFSSLHLSSVYSQDLKLLLRPLLVQKYRTKTATADYTLLIYLF